MKKLTEFRLRDGTSIQFEVDAVDPIAVTSAQTSTQPPVVRGMGSVQIAEKAEETLESALGRIRPIAEALIDKLRDLTQPPDTVQVEFGVKLSASAGAFIAAAATEANFKINLTWKRESAGK